MGKKKALAYGFGQQEAMLCEALASVGVETRLVVREELGMTLAALLMSGRQAVGGASEEPAVLVFSGVAREELDKLLGAIRGAGITTPSLKAMETPTNRSWALQRLMEELREEHRTMSALMELKRVRDSIRPNFLDPVLMGALAQADALLRGETEPTVMSIMEARMALERAQKN